MSEKVYIVKEECLGCETCAELCPDVFEMNDEGLAEVREGADTAVECVDDAIASCPAGCIVKE